MSDENVQPDIQNNRQPPPRQDQPDELRRGGAGNIQRPIDEFQQRNQQQDANFRRRMHAAQSGAAQTNQGERGQMNTPQNAGAQQNAAPAPSVGQGQITPEPSVTNSSGDVQADNATINQAQTIINMTIGVSEFEEFRRFFGGSKRDIMWVGRRGNISGNSDPLFRKFQEGIDAALPNIDFLGENTDADTKKSETKLPEAVEDIRGWYRQLNDIEKCFVQAAAVLSGSPEHEVRRATEELYKPFQEAEKRRLAYLSRVEAEEIFYFQRPTPSIILSTSFLAKTYTTIRKVEGARRLFWQDASTSGFSSFAVRLLEVAEEESPIGGQTGQSFLEHLESLSRKFEGEGSWRITRALGALWLNSDRAQLRWVANEWVKNGSAEDKWIWRVANLLFGAYEAECAELGQKALQSNNTVVLDLLSEWIWESHSASESRSRVNLGCAVAETYRLIGQKNFQQGLRGLDSLLHYPLLEQKIIPAEVFVSAILSYVAIGRFGSAREVLAHLASHVERFSHHRQDRNLRDASEYLYQRAIILNAAFDAFILLAAISLSAVQERSVGLYGHSQSLAKRPLIPDEQGKDILLAGMLARGETGWRQHITTILCAMLIEEKEEIAFYLMYEWAEIVVNLRDLELLSLRSSYLQRMVDIVKLAESWKRDLRKAGYDVYYRKSADILEEWRIKGRNQPLGAFAKDVQRRIEA